MDWTPHADHLARINSADAKRAYKDLVLRLGELFDCRPMMHGYIPSVRFSRGTWNPFDFIPNADDLRCYLRKPLLNQHPGLWPVVKQAFPEGDERSGEWSVLIADTAGSERVVALLTGPLRKTIESHPR
jgi:hypothetical protein